MYRTRALFAALLTFVLVAVPVTGATAAKEPSMKDKRQLTVMTQNLYLGSSLTPAITATTPAQFVAAVALIYGTAVATNFPKRAETIADTIDAERPDLIGLQEVTRWVTQPTGRPRHRRASTSSPSSRPSSRSGDCTTPSARSPRTPTSAPRRYSPRPSAAPRSAPAS